MYSELKLLISSRIPSPGLIQGVRSRFSGSTFENNLCSEYTKMERPILSKAASSLSRNLLGLSDEYEEFMSTRASGDRCTWRRRGNKNGNTFNPLPKKTFEFYFSILFLALKPSSSSASSPPFSSSEQECSSSKM